MASLDYIFPSSNTHTLLDDLIHMFLDEAAGLDIELIGLWICITLASSHV